MLPIQSTGVSALDQTVLLRGDFTANRRSAVSAIFVVKLFSPASSWCFTQFFGDNFLGAAASSFFHWRHCYFDLLDWYRWLGVPQLVNFLPQGVSNALPLCNLSLESSYSLL